MIKIREPKIKSENVLDFQSENVHSFEGQKCLEMHFDLNLALDECLGGRNDWGGRYAGFLNRIGLEHQTDSGWWNETAVDMKNLQFFVDWELGQLTEDEIDTVAYAMSAIESLPPRMKARLIESKVIIRRHLEEFA